MDIVKCILAALTMIGVVTCLVLRIMRKHKDIAYILELVSLVLIVVICILPLANGFSANWNSFASLFILIAACAYFLYRIFFRKD